MGKVLEKILNVYKDILISTIVDFIYIFYYISSLQGHINFYYCR